MLKEQLHIWIDIDIVLLVYPQKNQIAIDYDYPDTAFLENTMYHLHKHLSSVGYVNDMTTPQVFCCFFFKKA